MKIPSQIKEQMINLESEANIKGYRPKKSQSTKYNFLKTCHHYTIDPHFSEEFLNQEVERVEHLVSEYADYNNKFDKDGSETERKCYLEMKKVNTTNKAYLKALLFIRD